MEMNSRDLENNLFALSVIGFPLWKWPKKVKFLCQKLDNQNVTNYMVSLAKKGRRVCSEFLLQYVVCQEDGVMDRFTEISDYIDENTMEYLKLILLGSYIERNSDQDPIECAEQFLRIDHTQFTKKIFFVILQKCRDYKKNLRTLSVIFERFPKGEAQFIESYINNIPLEAFEEFDTFPLRSTRNFNVFFNKLIETKNHERIIHFWHIATKDIEPDTITYNILVKYLCSIQDFSSIIHLMKKFEPDQVTESTISKSYKSLDHEEKISIVRSVLHSDDFRDNNFLIRTFLTEQVRNDKSFVVSEKQLMLEIASKVFPSLRRTSRVPLNSFL